jgi:hypothetical protein
MVAEKYQGAKDALAGKERGGKHKKLHVHRVEIQRGHAGGYIAKHHLQDEEGNESPQTHEYPLSSMQQLNEHMQEHMGGEQAEAQPAPGAAGGAGAPSPEP